MWYLASQLQLVPRSRRVKAQSLTLRFSLGSTHITALGCHRLTAYRPTVGPPGAPILQGRTRRQRLLRAGWDTCGCKGTDCPMSLCSPRQGMVSPLSQDSPQCHTTPAPLVLDRERPALVLLGPRLQLHRAPP